MAKILTDEEFSKLTEDQKKIYLDQLNSDAAKSDADYNASIAAQREQRNAPLPTKKPKL